MENETKDNIKRTLNTLFQLFVFAFVTINIAYFFSLFDLHFIVNIILSFIIAIKFHNLVFENKNQGMNEDD